LIDDLLGWRLTGVARCRSYNAASRGDKFALQNATLAQGRDTATAGAAVRGAQFGSMIFINVSFSNNRLGWHRWRRRRGAVCKDEGGKFTIFDSNFTHNLAANGGAVKSNFADVQVVNSTFENNTARGGNNGGGAFTARAILKKLTELPIVSLDRRPTTDDRRPTTDDKIESCGRESRGLLDL
jgi:hypothetical protein